MEIYEKMLDNRLKAVVKISENQLGFTAGTGTTDGIFILRQIQQKYSEKKKEICHIFVDLEKAFDRVTRAAIRWVLKRQLVPERLVELMMELYSGSKSRIRAAGCELSSFEITVEVHQGSELSHLLFNLVMEEARRECSRRVPWDMLYEDDIVITATSREETDQLFEEWKVSMEKRGLKVNQQKTKFLVTGKKREAAVESGRYACGVCGSGVGVNSILCSSCSKWTHKRSSGPRKKF